MNVLKIEVVDFGSTCRQGLFCASDLFLVFMSILVWFSVLVIIGGFVYWFGCSLYFYFFLFF